MKSKRKKGSRKKGKAGKFLFLLILIGIGASMVYLFRQEIVHSLSPLLEKWNILEKKKEIVLYFSDRDGEYLIGEKRRITKKPDLKEEAKEAIIELIKGPREPLTPTLPPRTKCLNLRLDEKGVAIVNFNKALSKDHPGGSSAEIMTTYSIVNSLTLNFPKIKQIQILVEGKPIETIAGHLSLKQPISPNPSLIKRQ
jgi:spore germination protein GerM